MRRIPAPRRSAFRAAGCAAALLALLWWSAPLEAEELDLAANPAGVIDFPTALDQSTPNILHTTFEVFDLAAPDLRPTNLGYGRQWGNLQLLADMNWQPLARDFDHAEVKAKLRAVSFDQQQTYIGVGAVARWTDRRGKDKAEFDDKPYSLLGVVTTELFPFEAWGAFLVNFYLDNRFADLGLKTQIYQSIKLVAEADFHHGDVNNAPRKWRSKAGLQFDGDKNFYMQLLYDDEGNHMRVQLGGGF